MLGPVLCRAYLEAKFLLRVILCPYWLGESSKM